MAQDPALESKNGRSRTVLPRDTYDTAHGVGPLIDAEGEGRRVPAV
jgi:hypothetical protein